MANFALMSDLLEERVNLDLPILLVGPGLRTQGRNDGACLPMDVALLWFARKLHERNGKLVVLDLPQTKSKKGGFNDLRLVRTYLNGLSRRAELGPIEYVEADLGSDDIGENEYGLIWDHGTSDWAGLSDQRIIKYRRALRQNGKVLIASGKGISELSRNISITKNFVGEDRYRTDLSAQQIFGWTTRTDERYYAEGLLVPAYKFSKIFELDKTNAQSSKKPEESLVLSV